MNSMLFLRRHCHPAEYRQAKRVWQQLSAKERGKLKRKVRLEGRALSLRGGQLVPGVAWTGPHPEA